jgi:hypothetical protein
MLSIDIGLVKCAYVIFDKVVDKTYEKDTKDDEKKDPVKYKILVANTIDLR